VRAKKLADGVGVERGAVRHDHGDHAIAPGLVGDAHDGDLGDIGVQAQRLFDLERRELVAARLEDIDARAAEDLHVALGVARGGVAGAKPAVLVEGVARGVVAAVIAREHARAAHADLARLADGHVASVVADHTQLDGGERKTDRARLALALARVRRADADLGHPEAFDGDSSRDRAPSLGERDGEGGRAAGGQTKALRRRRPPRARRVVGGVESDEEAVVHRGDAHRDRRALELVPEAGGVEPGQHPRRGAGEQHGGERYAEPVEMVQG
jgi:hypothetical protein